jgi:beta-glucosidase/6-phospho-beta-glucosidase/beta-galactosidase
MQIRKIYGWLKDISLLELIFREERLRFWSDPDIELNLAKNTGIGVFRMGIDWSRIMPEEPVNGLKDIVSIVRPLIH